MNRTAFFSGTLLVSLIYLVIGCHAFANASTDVKAQLAATLPDCSQIARAVTDAFGPVALVKDVTKNLSPPGASPASAPGVLRACRVFMPGHSVPFVINYDGPMPTGELARMNTLQRRYDAANHHAIKLPGIGGADAAYRTPQTGRGNLIKAQMNTIEVSILAPRQNAAQAEKIARKIIALRPDSPRLAERGDKNGSASPHDPAEVIHYAGGMNGSVRFDSSSCTVVDAPGTAHEQFVGMDAPRRQVSDAASYNGPLLSVMPEKPGWTSVTFNPHAQSGGPGGMVFMQVIDGGVHVEHDGNNWRVVFTGARVGAWLVKNQMIQTSDEKAIVITGRVRCRKFD